MATAEVPDRDAERFKDDLLDAEVALHADGRAEGLRWRVYGYGGEQHPSWCKCQRVCGGDQ